MPKNHPSFRRKFSLRSLLLAGAVASLSLPLAQNTYGIGGSAIQAAYTPRESVGAAPSVSLIGSSSNSAAVASSGGGGGGEATSQGGGGGGGRRSVSSEDEGNGTTTRRRHPRKTKEGGTTRVARGSTTESKDAKERKEVAPLVRPPDKPLITISTGYETRYMYHGLDIISFNSRTDADGDRSSAIAYTNVDFAFKGLHLGVGYINSVSTVIPFFQFTTFNTGPLKGAQRVDTTQRYFQEVDVNVDYTVQVVANILDATIGYNSYIFPNNQFKGTGYQSELIFRLAYKQIPYITPSFTYYHDFSEFHNNNLGNLNGNLVEFRLDASIPIIKKENFGITFAPYVTSIYNIDYLKYNNGIDRPGDVGGFSNLETGIKLPISFAKHFTVTPYGNYGMDLTDQGTTPIDNHTNRAFGERTTFWGGVTFSYTF